MRKFLVLFGLLFALTLNAQQMPSVAGVTFGWSYSSCKRVLDNKFNGGESSYQSTANELNYYDVQFGGHYFDFASFLFQNDGNRTYLSRIKFYSHYELSQAKNAEKFRDDLYDLYSKKYEFRWSDYDDNGYKYYVLGYDPINHDDGFIVIDTVKGENNKGEMKLWTEITYIVDFINPEDEI